MRDGIRCLGRLAVLAGTVLSTLTACGNPLDVESTSRIPAENVEVPANAQLLVSGAIADFECAYAAYVVQSATVGEEFIYAQQTADRVPSDRRSTLKSDARYATSTCDLLGIYTPLQTARQSSETALGYLKGWTDAEVANRTRLIAHTAAYSGYSYLLLGEGFCTLAFSSINPDRSIAYGGEVSRDSAFRIAVTRFTESITAAAAVPNQSAALKDSLLLAYLGRARARLDLGDYAGAKADAAVIPAGYTRNATYSDAVTRRNNFVYADNSSVNTSSSVGDPYRSMTGDPRVPVTAGTVTSTTGIRHYYQGKYTTVSSPIAFAKYAEAQLIIAEAEIRANNLPAALPILNAARARGNQGAFAGTTQAAYLAELIDQRRRDLFLEGQHLGDLIRFPITPQPAAGTNYHFGGVYGTQLCFPLPNSERLNNPLIGS
jgi:hypothetical protein